MELRLSALRLGERAYITRLEPDGEMTGRLEDLGFTPGTRVECELLSPAGDPAAYRVRQALIALRRRDAHRVLVSARGEGDTA